MKKYLKIYFLVLIAHFGYAQVKIGSNPTAITTNKNLEIEATNGKKLNINKDDGRTYIQNKPTAALTDSLVLRYSDGELRQMSVERLHKYFQDSEDLDGDGIPNGTDPDDDGDGIDDTSDKCPLLYGCASVPSNGATHGCPVNCFPSNTSSISSLDCANPTNVGTLTSGSAASGVTSTIAYTGGNGSSHNGQVVTSTGVTGLTATLPAGTFANGNGTLTYTITGTPSGAGTASFAINIGGQTCTLSVNVVGLLSFLNGSFENCSGYNVCPPGWSNCLSTNTVGLGLVDCNFWSTGTQPSSAQSGNNYIRYQQGHTESIAQTFTTIIGATYNISCWIFNGSGGTFQISQNGTVIKTQPGNTGSWVKVTASFTATSTSTEIRLAGVLTSASADLGLDNVTFY